jgi:MFS family permease
MQYLLNYLDRGNIGNSKLLNSETGDSLIEQTNMTNLQYATAVSLFAVAYALFEVPSNWIMKRYVRPSRWLATLLLLWGIFTIGFAGVQNFAQVTILRFFIGVFEAGFFPGNYAVCVVGRSTELTWLQASSTSSLSGTQWKSDPFVLLSCWRLLRLPEPLAGALHVRAFSLIVL